MGDTRALYKVTDECLEAYKEFKLKRKFKWVMFGIEEDGSGNKMHKVMDKEADKSTSVDDLIAALPEHDCRFIVYEHEYVTKDDRKTDKLFFINWNPRSCPTAQTMDYLTGRPSIREVCDGCFDVSASGTADVKDGVLGTRTDDSDQDDDNDDSWMD